MNYCKYKEICEYSNDNSCTKQFQDKCEQKLIYDTNLIGKKYE